MSQQETSATGEDQSEVSSRTRSNINSVYVVAGIGVIIIAIVAILYISGNTGKKCNTERFTDEILQKFNKTKNIILPGHLFSSIQDKLQDTNFYEIRLTGFNKLKPVSATSHGGSIKTTFATDPDENIEFSANISIKILPKVKYINFTITKPVFEATFQLNNNTLTVSQCIITSYTNRIITSGNKVLDNIFTQIEADLNDAQNVFLRIFLTAIVIDEEWNTKWKNDPCFK